MSKDIFNFNLRSSCPPSKSPNNSKKPFFSLPKQNNAQSVEEPSTYSFGSKVPRKNVTENKPNFGGIVNDCDDNNVETMPWHQRSVGDHENSSPSNNDTKQFADNFDNFRTQSSESVYCQQNKDLDKNNQPNRNKNNIVSFDDSSTADSGDEQELYNSSVDIIGKNETDMSSTEHHQTCKRPSEDEASTAKGEEILVLDNTEKLQSHNTKRLPRTPLPKKRQRDTTRYKNTEVSDSRVTLPPSTPAMKRNRQHMAQTKTETSQLKTSEYTPEKVHGKKTEENNKQNELESLDQAIGAKKISSSLSGVQLQQPNNVQIITSQSSLTHTNPRGLPKLYSRILETCEELFDTDQKCDRKNRENRKQTMAVAERILDAIKADLQSVNDEQIGMLQKTRELLKFLQMHVAEGVRRVFAS